MFGFKNKLVQSQERHFLVSVKMYREMTFVEESTLHLVGKKGQMFNRAEETLRIIRAHKKKITRCVFGVPMEYSEADCKAFTTIPEYIQQAISAGKNNSQAKSQKKH